MKPLRAAADLVWPASCAGCGAPAGPLCPDCRAELMGPVTRRESGAARLNPADGGPPFPVWCSAWYTGAVRHAIVAWKRVGRGDLEREMARAAARTAEAAARVLGEVTAALAVVPAPSRLARRWSRPARGTEVLGLAVAGALAGTGLDAVYAEALGRAPWAREQSGKSSRQRQAGREDTTWVRGGRFPGGGDRPVLLVDDVLTTGATLLDAERALARAGRATVGAVVLAVSPARSALPPGADPLGAEAGEGRNIG
ncbi:MAG: hypothetical protein LBL01_05255 [Bifidobacteriaceae bacterium]|jgi:predicted amidophosphoribosyltransferase|nr:hypothetical protein [Bifidobacteriaceae bacterium]